MRGGDRRKPGRKARGFKALSRALWEPSSGSQRTEQGRQQVGLVPTALSRPVLSPSHPAGAERDQHLLGPPPETTGPLPAGDSEEPGRPQACSTRARTEAGTCSVQTS